MSSTTILGLSAYYHDSAACLVRNGAIIAAAQEERFTRKRHDATFPVHAIAYCLSEAKVRVNELTHVCFYDKPVSKFMRILESHVAVAPKGLRAFLMAMPVWLRQKLWTAREIEDALSIDREVLFTEHHQAHASSAFFPSPFESAAVLTLDGVGEWATTTAGWGRGRELVLDQEIRFPHSIGLLYSAFTYYTGFKINSGEYKLMGLAPYGAPRFVDAILEHLVDVKEDGSFRLNMSYFDYVGGLRMTNERFHSLFGGPPRAPESPITERDMDLAASIQKVIELVVLRICRALQQRTGEKNLCLAGGVALNCVANGKITKETSFERVWVQPGAGDAGGAVGAALAVWHTYLGRERNVSPSGDAMAGAYLGPQFNAEQIASALVTVDAVSSVLEDDALFLRVAGLLDEGAVIGWFSGRMEFGPRALGARSILGDPRKPEMQRTMNLRIKFRESFRPFAPAVLEEDAHAYFELDGDSPYMLVTAPVRSEHLLPVSEADAARTGFARLDITRSSLPAITHVDGSARVQTVSRRTHPRFHALLTAWKKRTGCSVLVNTSFNVRGEPIVCTPSEAYRCFMRTDIDALVLENHLLLKADQPAWKEGEEWQSQIPAD